MKKYAEQFFPGSELNLFFQFGLNLFSSQIYSTFITRFKHLRVRFVIVFSYKESCGKMLILSIMNKDKQVKTLGIIRTAWPFFLALIVFLSTRIAIANRPFIEHYYSRGFYPLVASSFSFISNLVPFSLWDVFWIVFFLLIITGLVMVLFRKIKLGRYLLRTIQSVAILYSFFYLVWGYNYFRPAIQDRVGWKVQASDSDLFRQVLDSIISEANINYISIKPSDYAQIDKLVEESYLSQSRQLALRYPNGSRKPKTMIFSKFYGKLGLSGYFGPFFNEIHLNRILLPMDYPFVLGHEKAHQFGVASEAEANLIGFIVCVKSGDQRLRYSGYMSLLLYFMRDASHLKDYHEIIKRINPRVLDDLRYRQKYYQGLENVTLSDIQTAANNSYLKVNHIEKGVQNYNQVVSLVISWYYNTKSGRSTD
jgi:hypothetical protein